jgi:hypothetical protein
LCQSSSIAIQHAVEEWQWQGYGGAGGEAAPEHGAAGERFHCYDSF